MVPATNEHALYSQMSQIRINHFTRDEIKSVDYYYYIEWGHEFHSLLKVDKVVGSWSIRQGLPRRVGSARFGE